MNLINIDFAPRHFKRRLILKQPSRPLVLAMLGGLLPLIFATVWLVRQSNAAAETQQQLEAVNKRFGAYRHAQSAKSQLSPETAKAVNQAILKLNFPWEEILQGVETGTSANIAVLSLKPDTGHYRITILAEAKDPEAMLAYVKQLNDGHFHQAALTKHEINRQDPNEPYRFEIIAPLRKVIP